ncbi:RNA polymerase sigma factor [Hufsiella ginkgonis]|uniref:Sigma-70 family RNA polymerase sigma factor n=1 Tax=Hufsiella ginkgonis TaxID=2695274 RepID=A0A7K1XXT7_9SPHI|nr:sigma-70 family RNA polymerase sigma factor [Hufsiella ginkgonis]MXV15336.1 sigma-70 family RNA polymerase sigma factor [Hufsiella ginkgonis]
MKTATPGTTAAGRPYLFRMLYKSVFPSAAAWIARRGGTFDEAEDVFQDALLVYYEKAMAGKSTAGRDEKAYLFGIVKHLWVRKFRQRITNVTFEEVDADLPDEVISREPAAEVLLQHLSSAGKKCMELLKAFYYDKLPARQLSEMFGFSGTRSVTVQKYKCLEKVRETVKQKALTYEDFLK